MVTNNDVLSNATGWRPEVLVELKDALREKRLVVVVGLGVTLSAAADDTGVPPSRLTWTGMIRNGLEYLVTQSNPSCALNGIIKRAYEALERPDIDGRLDAANSLYDWLSQIDQFSIWLESLFDNLYRDVRHSAVLKALKALHKRDVMLLTTNYDNLLEHYCKIRRVSWSNSDDLKRFKDGRLDGVLHIYGSYCDPHEVHLDPRTFYQIQHTVGLRDFLTALSEGKTILFIGSGSGLEDPNFDAMWNWVTKNKTDVPAKNYDSTAKQDTPDRPLVLYKYSSDYLELLHNLLDDSRQHLASAESDQIEAGMTVTKDDLRERWKPLSAGDESLKNVHQYSSLNTIDPKMFERKLLCKECEEVAFFNGRKEIWNTKESGRSGWMMLPAGISATIYRGRFFIN